MCCTMIRMYARVIMTRNEQSSPLIEAGEGLVSNLAVLERNYSKSVLHASASVPGEFQFEFYEVG